MISSIGGAIMVLATAVSYVEAQEQPRSHGINIGDDIPLKPHDLDVCTNLRPDSTEASRESYHVVLRNESLSGISKSLYGNEWAIDSLRSYNNTLFSYPGHDPDMRLINDHYVLYVSQKIPVPPAKWVVIEWQPKVQYRPFGQNGANASLVISGSGTLFPVAAAISTCYAFARIVDIPGVPKYNGKIRVGGEGTKAGEHDFCGGVAQIGTASDTISDDELRQTGCTSDTKIDRFVIARDAIVVVANPQNPVVNPCSRASSMPRQALCDLFRNADERLNLYLPTANSGTGRRVGRYCGDENLIAGANGKVRDEDYDYLASRIAADPMGLGIVGYYFYSKHADSLVMLTPDGVDVNFENVATDKYPLARDLYVYTSEALLSDPIIFNWINMAVASMAPVLERIKYFPVKPGTREQSEGLLRRAPLNDK